MNPMQDQNLSPEQVIQLTQAMLSVAAVDGMHPAEAALIGQFFESSRRADMPSTANLLASSELQPFDVATLAGSSDEFAETLILMCLMTAYADGQLSMAERVQVQAMANAAGLEASRFDALLAQVRDQLVGALSGLPDAGSVAVVVKELAAAD